MNKNKQLNMIFKKGASLKKLEQEATQRALPLTFRFEQDAQKGKGIDQPTTAFQEAA